MWRNLKCITSERGHSGKSVLCLTPTCDILENGKTVGMVKGPVVSMVGEGHGEQADQRGFLRYKKKKKQKNFDTEMMNMCHNAFVEIHRLCKTKRKP